jgi:two-component system KDP operon response regulator KdpE
VSAMPDSPAPRVLVVEDDSQIRRFVSAALREAGCAVGEAGTVARGLEDAATHPPRLVILDLGLPDRDGVDFIRSLRAWSSVPVLVLSARSGEQSKVDALDAGADDYLTKPFGIGELRARVRALLRRPATGSEGACHRFGSNEANLARRLVTREGTEVHLTEHEFRLLSVLLNHPGRVLTHRMLMDAVWGPGHAEHAHYLRVYVGRLRQKLEDDPTRPRHLITETGVGYRFIPDPKETD